MSYAIITKNSRLSDIIIAEPVTLTVIGRFGIKLGMGDRTVQQVCDDLSIDADVLVCLLNTFIHDDYFPEKQLTALGIERVVNYLKKTNAYYLHFMLPTIERHFELLVSRSDDDNGNLHMMRQYFDTAKQRLTERIKHDNEVWFPAIMTGKNDTVPEEDDDIEDRINDLMSMFVIHLKGDYDTNLGHAVVLSLAGLRDDLHQHNRIRERILRPHA